MQPSEHAPTLACTNCGNNLAGVSHRAACPNCGKPVQSVLQELSLDTSPPPEAAPVPVDNSGPISSDLPCLACGYNLRGLDSRSACPECGTPVENSTRGALIIYAGPDFTAKLHQGAKSVEWAVALRFVAIATLIALSVFKVPEYLIVGLALIAAIVVFCFSTYGWWQLTSPHVVLRGLDRLRSWTRSFLIIGNLLELSFVASMTRQAPGATGLVTSVIPVSPCLLFPIFVAFWLTSIVLCLCYAVGIARRTPNRTMATLSVVGAWLVPGLVLGPIPFFFTIVIPLIAWLGGYVYYFVVIDRWRSELRLVHKRALEKLGQVMFQADSASPGPPELPG